MYEIHMWRIGQSSLAACDSSSVPKETPWEPGLWNWDGDAGPAVSQPCEEASLKEYKVLIDGRLMCKTHLLSPQHSPCRDGRVIVISEATCVSGGSAIADPLPAHLGQERSADGRSGMLALMH